MLEFITPKTAFEVSLAISLGIGLGRIIRDTIIFTINTLLSIITRKRNSNA